MKNQNGLKYAFLPDGVKIIDLSQLSLENDTLILSTFETLASKNEPYYPNELSLQYLNLKTES